MTEPKNSMGKEELLLHLSCWVDEAQNSRFHKWRNPDKQAYAQLVKIVKQSAFIESALRRELWINHGCPFAALYGDDGEMQCGQCLIDFKRMPIADLVQKIADQRLTRAGLEIAKQADTQAEQSDGDKIFILNLRQIAIEQEEVYGNSLRAKTINKAIQFLTQKREVTLSELREFAHDYHSLGQFLESKGVVVKNE